ncbi:MAG: hypothetical protein H0X73_15330 [Chthoniobacterales bacterium]|nr:hypothetical protein [Chthoniobacterales bacterium]
MANQVTVNLTGVSNAQHLIVMLNGVRDSAGAVSNNLPARMDVLRGDVNATGRTDSSDVTLVKQQNAKAPTQTTFRTDVNCSGRIDSSDVKVTQQASGTALP